MRRFMIALGVLLLLAAPSLASVTLGDIEVRSFLNQPLDAQIRVHGVALTDDSLDVRLASEADFRRAGLLRGAIPSDLAIGMDGSGASRVIRLTTQRPVREPYVGVLLEVSWAGGRALREFTLLLDPPVAYSPDRRAPPVITPSSAPERPAAPPPAPVSAPPPPRAEPIAVAETPRVVRVEAPAVSAVAQTYRVRPGDTLIGIVRGLGYPWVSDEQVMIAIQRANPSAFAGGNINLLVSDVTLRLPSMDDVVEVDAQEARVEVRRQTEAWRTRAQPAPALVPAPAPAVAVTAPVEPASPPSPPPPAVEPPSPLPVAPAPVAATPAPAQPPVIEDRLEILAERPAMEDVVAMDRIRLIEEALLSQRAATAELRSEVSDLRDELSDRLLSVFRNEMAAVEARMREIQTQQSRIRPQDDFGGRAMHERILMDPLLLILSVTLVMLFVLLVAALFRSPRAQTMPALAGMPSEPVAPVASFEPEPVRTEPVVRTREEPHAHVRGKAASMAGAASAARSMAERESLGGGERGAAPERGSGVGRVAISVEESGGEDVLADVDLYLAYGMNAQAVAVLERAIQEGRGSMEYRTRLLEAHAANRDVDAVRKLSASLRARLGPEESEWIDRIQAAEARFPELVAEAGSQGVVPSIPRPQSVAAKRSEKPVTEMPETLRFDLEEAGPVSATAGAGVSVAERVDRQTDDLPPLAFVDFGSTADQRQKPAAAGTGGARAAVEQGGALDSSENGVRLSLAEAFVEMGQEGEALALIEEVMQTATDAQRAKAQRLRHQIGA